MMRLGWPKQKIFNIPPQADNHKNMDDKKRKKIIWIAIILFVIMGILFLVMRLSDQEANLDPIEKSVEEQPVFEPKSVELEYEEPELEEVEVAQFNVEFSVTNLAKSYASRFGSWSTDNRGKNLDELITLSTSKMRQYLNDRDLGPAEVDYTGITTKSLSAEILELSDDEAVVLVGTQRLETDKDLDENIYYQNIEISMTKSGDTWLVDAAYWQ